MSPSNRKKKKKQTLTPIREFLVLPMVVRVLRLKISMNSAFSKGRVREVKAGCWIFEWRQPLGAGAIPLAFSTKVRLERAHAISPNTILYAASSVGMFFRLNNA